ncbi:hypothetical protein PSTG_03178 [Puccinia striiformis f. sp. tritici PST-78]|uniref:Uncharacterized protein n=1 Tax=Puccinia striiformis f. sp. tritici PST-78 TaxID=1165861 RepID=A0A0L0VWT8_9BASI|nr:hypothetical protein PSTG_03178 [Puccinia striiformis f. sp. tritici PST-78]
MEAVFGSTLTNYLFKFININRSNQNTKEEQEAKQEEEEEERERGQEPEHEPISVEEHQEVQQKQPIPVIPTSSTKPQTQDEQQQQQTTTSRFTRKTTTTRNQRNRTLYLGPGISNSAKSSRTRTQNEQQPINNKRIKLTSTNQQQQQPQPQTPQAIKPNPSSTINRFKKGTPIRPSPLRNVTTVTSSPPTPKQNNNNTPTKKRKAGCSSIMNSVMKEVNLEFQSRAPSPSPIKPSEIINPYSVLQRPIVRLNNRTSNHNTTAANLTPNPNIDHQKLRKRKIQSCLDGTAITESPTSVDQPPTNPMEHILQQTMPKEYREEEHHQDKKIAKTRQVGKLPDRLIKKQKLLEEKKKKQNKKNDKKNEKVEIERESIEEDGAIGSDKQDHQKPMINPTAPLMSKKTSDLIINSALIDRPKKSVGNHHDHQESSTSIPPIKNNSFFFNTKSPVNSNPDDHFKNPSTFDKPVLTKKKDIINHSPIQEDQSSMMVVDNVTGYTDQYILMNFFERDLLDGFILPNHLNQSMVVDDLMHADRKRVVLGFGVNELSEFSLL